MHVNKLNKHFQVARTSVHEAVLATLVKEADAMHALLVVRADALMGCTEGSPEEEELASLTDAIEAYETKRWPEGKIPGGKG
jgi:hypothetical protein